MERAQTEGACAPIFHVDVVVVSPHLPEHSVAETLQGFGEPVGIGGVEIERPAFIVEGIPAVDMVVR
jgi:hypothetical protein